MANMGRSVSETNRNAPRDEPITGQASEAPSAALHGLDPFPPTTPAWDVAIAEAPTHYMSALASNGGQQCFEAPGSVSSFLLGLSLDESASQADDVYMNELNEFIDLSQFQEATPDH